MKVLVYDDKDERILACRIRSLSESLIQIYKDQRICQLVPPNKACYSCDMMNYCDDAASVVAWCNQIISRIDHGN